MVIRRKPKCNHTYFSYPNPYICDSASVFPSSNHLPPFYTSLNKHHYHHQNHHNHILLLLLLCLSLSSKKSNRMNDTVDKLVVFLAKRDGIDKLVKTFQYVSKLANWRVEANHPDLAKRFKNWEVSSGLSRKAFRTGRFLTGFNGLRRNPGSTLTLRLLALPANAGEMVYFFFDHFLWLARIGTLDASLAKKMSFISAFGESVGYVFFIIADFLLIKEGIKKERKIRRMCKEEEEKTEEEEEKEKSEIKKIRVDRVMRLMAVAANTADLIIGLAEIEPNPFCNHAVTLGISGLVSAWAGWYRNWPS